MDDVIVCRVSDDAAVFRGWFLHLSPSERDQYARVCALGTETRPMEVRPYFPSREFKKIGRSLLFALISSFICTSPIRSLIRERQRSFVTFLLIFDVCFTHSIIMVFELSALIGLVYDIATKSREYL